jgi:hypothetical protein
MRPVRQAPSGAELPHLRNRRVGYFGPQADSVRGSGHTKLNQEQTEAPKRRIERTGPRSGTHRSTPLPPRAAPRSHLSPRLIARIPEASETPPVHPRRPRLPVVKAVRWARLDEAGP